MSITIEKGKCYRTRDGLKVGPLRWCEGHAYPWRGTVVGALAINGSTVRTWTHSGSYRDDRTNHELDLVAEWTEEEPAPATASPVRTATRKEIAPGTYGVVEVVWARSRTVEVGLLDTVLVASELRDAARIFTELADALEEQE